MSGNDQDRVLLAHCVPLLETSFFGWRQKKDAERADFFYYFASSSFQAPRLMRGLIPASQPYTWLRNVGIPVWCVHS